MPVSRSVRPSVVQSVRPSVSHPQAVSPERWPPSHVYPQYCTCNQRNATMSSIPAPQASISILAHSTYTRTWLGETMGVMRSPLATRTRSPIPTKDPHHGSYMTRAPTPIRQSSHSPHGRRSFAAKPGRGPTRTRHVHVHPQASRVVPSWPGRAVRPRGEARAAPLAGSAQALGPWRRRGGRRAVRQAPPALGHVRRERAWDRARWVGEGSPLRTWRGA